MYEYKAKVTNVVDGDTIDITVDLGFDVTQSMRVRLLGIDTPETRTKDLEEKRKGLAAKARVAELVLDKTVTIKTQKDSTEKFGRYLATIFIGEVNLNELLLAEGHAKPYFGGTK